MRTSLSLVLLGALVGLSTGCAAIVGGGSNQALSIEATPSAARYTIRSSSGIEMSAGSVPASVRLPRKNEYQVDISLAGYEPRTVAITRGTNGWIWGNLVIGWIVGFIIDFATGAAYKLEPAFVNVTLERADDQTFALVDILDEDRKLIRQERLLLLPLP
jgi:hypothetical protein